MEFGKFIFHNLGLQIGFFLINKASILKHTTGY